jgi:hypothetical protein
MRNDEQQLRLSLEMHVKHEHEQQLSSKACSDTLFLHARLITVHVKGILASSSSDGRQIELTNMTPAAMQHLQFGYQYYRMVTAAVLKLHIHAAAAFRRLWWWTCLSIAELSFLYTLLRV